MRCSKLCRTFSQRYAFQREMEGRVSAATLKGILISRFFYEDWDISEYHRICLSLTCKVKYVFNIPQICHEVTKMGNIGFEAANNDIEKQLSLFCSDEQSSQLNQISKTTLLFIEKYTSWAVTGLEWNQSVSDNQSCRKWEFYGVTEHKNLLSQTSPPLGDTRDPLRLNHCVETPWQVNLKWAAEY